MSDSPEQVKKRLEMRGFSREQVGEMQKLAAAMAQQQVKNSIGAASNFVSTVVALLSSAVGFVAAFAWNDAIKGWLSSAELFKSSDTNVRNFTYAIVATVFAVIVIAILGIVNGRIKGKSLIAPTQF